MKREQFFEFLDANGISAEPGCNQRIMDLYEKLTGQKSFETFNGWKSKGRKVKKGESSFPIFSRPVHVLQAEKQDRPVDDEPRFKFYSICHLFHYEQTEPM